MKDIYRRTLLQDAEKIEITWRFDEQQADPIHKNDFVEELKRELKQSLTESKPKPLAVVRSWDKPNEYTKDGILKNMRVWDWIVTYSGDVRQITHDDMDDLYAEDILRFATRKEVKEAESD